jgi:protocatechuate 4,5-dioxygenase alpha chain
MCNVGGSFIGVTQLRDRFARGRIINRFCVSLREPNAQRIFSCNEGAYCLEFGLNREERQAVKDRDFETLVDMGGFVPELDSLAALSGLTTLQAIRMRRRR